MISRRRFTEAEDAIIRADWAAYVPTIETARKLGRDEPTLRQRILRLGLRRSITVTKCLAWAPDHLREQVSTMTTEDWLAACFAWREGQRVEGEALQEKLDTEEQHRMALAAAEIDGRHDLTRREKMVAKRLAGLTLEAIGQQHGITSERVRQLTTMPARETAPPAAFRVGVGRKPGVPNLNKIERLEIHRRQIVAAEIKCLLDLWNVAPQEVRDGFLERITRPEKEDNHECEE